MAEAAALFEQLKNEIRKYAGSEADLSSVEKAYEFCAAAHSGQTRKSGEPYIVHPLSVAIILAEYELDRGSIIAGMLHDVIEDTKYTYDDIKNEFGEEVAMLVDGVSNLKKIKYTSKEDQQVENLRKMFFAMAKDVRVIFIKLADRLHNMRTLKFMSESKQREKARETLEVYAPLAHRLGISKIKGELEDLSLRYIDPVAYFDIVDGVNKIASEREEYVNMLRSTLEEKMKAANVKCRIDGRVKHYYSIYRKMYLQDKTLDEIYDILAVRIIVDTVEDCYTALCVVHENYRPIPGRVKDYIGCPKPNGYQSLHTTVIGPNGHPFEIQIRTWEMHTIAEEGVAAHWKYKEGISGKNDMDETLRWIRQMIETQDETTDNEEFMQTLKIDLFADAVFVFTPKGDVISLPAGSTPIDFAFSIHSAVGYRMTGAKANGHIVPLDYTLQNGDIVEVMTSSTVHGPSRDWLKVVKTSQARTKINAWFKKENRDENIARGKEAIERELRRVGSNAQDELFKSEYIEPMLRRYGFKTLDDMYSAVGYGGIGANKIILRLRDYYAQEHKEQEEITVVDPAKKRRRNYKNVIEVEGIDNCLVHLSRCCTPIRGDRIIGFVTRGRGVAVHRADCVNVSSDALTDEMRARMVKCNWVDVNEGSYKCQLTIEGTDRMGFLADVSTVISESRIPIISINAKQKSKSRLAIIEIVMEISGLEVLEELIKKLRRISGVHDVIRSNR